MSVENNKAVVRQLFEAFEKKNIDSLDRLVAKDYVDHPRRFQGLENYKQHLALWFKSFPDSHETIEDIVAEGDKVAIRIRGTATHTGEYHGLSPTGNTVTWEANTILRIADGKIAEMWAFSDELNFSRQLGLVEL